MTSFSQGSPCMNLFSQEGSCMTYVELRAPHRGYFPFTRKVTKGVPKTSWFLDFQRRGSRMTPFEPPHVGSNCAR